MVRLPLLVRQSLVNLLTPELIPLPRKAACRDFLLGILVFNGLLRDVFISRSPLNGYRCATLI
jgi:hypothetical protein